MAWKYLARVGFVLAILFAIGSINRASVIVSVIGDVDIGTDTGEKREVVEEKKKVALTFDDGPSPSATPLLLDALKERGVKVTFFVIGESAEAYPDIVQREFEEGHIVGNHTYDHSDIRVMSVADAIVEIQKTDNVIYEITGELPEYIRPPFGAWNDELDEKTDLISVLWNVDPLDWTTENVDEIVNKVVTDVSEGDIILLHDSYVSSAQAAIRIIDILSQSGYEFVTVDELILN